MPAPNFSCGQGDSATWIEPVFDDDGNPIDLTIPGTTVALHYRIDDLTQPAQDRAAAVAGTTTPGGAAYTFLAPDTPTPGRYRANFLITQGSRRYSCPTRGHFYFEITAPA